MPYVWSTHCPGMPYRIQIALQLLVLYLCWLSLPTLERYIYPFAKIETHSKLHYMLWESATNSLEVFVMLPPKVMVKIPDAMLKVK